MTRPHEQCEACDGTGFDLDDPVRRAECPVCVGTGLAMCDDPSCCSEACADTPQPSIYDNFSEVFPEFFKP